eukprot:758404-Hanusia_phi.AAC.7
MSLRDAQRAGGEEAEKTGREEGRRLDGKRVGRGSKDMEGGVGNTAKVTGVTDQSRRGSSGASPW